MDSVISPLRNGHGSHVTSRDAAQIKHQHSTPRKVDESVSCADKHHAIKQHSTRQPKLVMSTYIHSEPCGQNLEENYPVSSERQHRKSTTGGHRKSSGRVARQNSSDHAHLPLQPATAGSAACLSGSHEVKPMGSVKASYPDTTNSVCLPIYPDKDVLHEMQRSLAEFENETIQKQRQELHLLIAELRDRDRELNDMVATHQRQLSSWDHDRHRALKLDEKCIRLEKELQSRNEEFHSVIAQLRILESEELNRRTALESTREQLSVVTEQHSQTSVKMIELQDQVRAMNRTIRELQDQVQQFEHREQELLIILNSKDRDLSDASSSIAELNARQKRSELQVADARAEEAELRRAVAEGNNKIMEIRREAEHFKRQAQKLEQQCDERHIEIQRLKQDLNTSKKEVLLTGEREKRKDQLLALQKSKQERTDSELTNLRELYEKQQREMTLLQLNLESMKGLLAHHHKSFSRVAAPTSQAVDNIFTPQSVPSSFATNTLDNPEIPHHYPDSSKPGSHEMLPEKETSAHETSACQNSSSPLETQPVADSFNGKSLHDMHSYSSYPECKNSVASSIASTSLLFSSVNSSFAPRDDEHNSVSEAELSVRSVEGSKRGDSLAASIKDDAASSVGEGRHSASLADGINRLSADQLLSSMRDVTVSRGERHHLYQDERRCNSAIDVLAPEATQTLEQNRRCMSAACSVKSGASDGDKTPHAATPPAGLERPFPQSHSVNSVSSLSSSAAGAAAAAPDEQFAEQEREIPSVEHDEIDN